MPESIWTVTEAWRENWPGATGGILAIRGFQPTGRPEPFDESLTETEELLIDQFAPLEREAIRQTGNIAHYHRYYRSFGQNYHVQHQIESIAKKGRKIPRRQILVEIGFKWELRNGILTGVHDLADVAFPVVLDSAAEPVAYQGYGEHQAEVRQNDMYYRDGVDVLSSIVGGPSHHGRIQESTGAALFTVYGVPGVAAAEIESHLQQLWADVRLIEPNAELIELSSISV
ncbi:MAG: hypothetical protein KF883_13335 [Thermomicrobiales bacterium]|nr:hypothetical protein [Thermomicrobiales bacterium]